MLQPEVFDVAAVARQVVAEHSLSAREKEVRVKLEFGEECADDALVSGEALLTHSLLQNLFRNALVSLELRVARDGAEALELLRQETFAAALVDLETAGLQGLAVAGAFRQWQREQAEAEPGTVFLGLVATADAGVRERCVEAGFERVLVKPLSRRRLQEELLNALQPGRQVVQLDVAIRDLIPDFLLGQQTILDECEALLAAGEGGLARALTQRLQCRFAMHGFVTAAQLSAQAHAATRAQRLVEAAEKLRELRTHLLELEIRYA